MASDVFDEMSPDASTSGVAPTSGGNGLPDAEGLAPTTSSAGGSDLAFEVDAKAPGKEEPGDRGLPGDEQTVISRRNAPSDKPSSVAESSPVESLSRADLGDRLEGTNLGHFRLEKFVGGGGMGSVFRAVDMRLGRTVAVKVLSRDRTEPETLRRFQNEAQSAARLDHENIARVYYVGEDRGLHFLVFEFIEGINIRDLVEEKGPLPLSEAISYTLQVAEALEHASQRQVVHRDIKPSNILVTAEGRAKLVDMGLARLRMESDRNDLTASGVTLGTFDYISPEQARDPRIADVRSDLYSLGCTLYYMLTGRPPFPEGTLLQKLLSHSSDRPDDPRLVRPELDEQVVQILDKLLAKQPGDRHQQPNELIGELLLVADRLNLPGLNLTGAVWVGSRQSRWTRIERALPWLLPIVLLFASVFVLERLWSGPQGDLRPESAPKRKAALEPAVRTTDRAGPQESAEAAGAEVAAIDGGDEAEAAEEPLAETPGLPDAAAKPSGAGAGRNPTAPQEPAPASDAAQPAGPLAPTPAAPPTAAPKPQPPPPPGETALEPGTAATVDKGSGQAADAAQPPAVPPAAADSQTPSEPAPAQEPAPGATSNAEAPALTRIIIAAADYPLPADAQPAVSLAAACRAAVALGLDTIELHFNGIREESAFSVSSPKLNIRNGAGFDPTIVFRPGFEELAEERRMIRVVGGSLVWSGVHVRLELPADHADGWAVFSLRSCELFDLQNAVVTVCNVSSQGLLLQDRVSVLEWFEAPTPGAFAWAGSEVAAKRAIPPYIGLANCVVRGQTALLHCERATPLRISARQCLFILADNLLAMGGREFKPVQLDARIELALRNVTAVLGRGLCKLSSDAMTPFQLELVTDCRQSILYLTDADAALIERRGVGELAELDKQLYVRGRDNFYPGSDILLRLSPDGDPSTALRYGFTNRSESWYQEESPRFTLMWKSLPPADLPWDQHLPSDYLLDASESNPAWYNAGEAQAGADASQLPAMSAAARTAS